MRFTPSAIFVYKLRGHRRIISYCSISMSFVFINSNEDVYDFLLVSGKKISIAILAQLVKY